MWPVARHGSPSITEEEVGIGNSIHAGFVLVADGTERAGRAVSRVLNNDPGLGVARHADAGYPASWKVAESARFRIPGP